jgi:hypothetical protein
MTPTLLELQVDDEVYVSVAGFEFIKDEYEDLAGYAFTSKVRIVRGASTWFHDDHNDEVGSIYEALFVNDPDQNIIELTDRELSFTPLHYFDVLAKNANTLTTHEDGQIELEIEDDVLVVPTTYEEKGRQLGALVDRKQKAYGNAIEQTYNVVEVFMRPYETEDGYVIPKSLLRHLLFQVRIIDKQNRIFNNPNGDLMDESPYGDISGYGLLGSNMNTK